MALAMASRRGLTYRQIADRLGRSDRETAQLIREALLRVRRLLVDEPTAGHPAD
jgi:DNA-directed RNA polymerase specialized sigma24 family protein